jgi:FKBP-type peptidyl-prolyl cis-trans isomerase
LPTSADTNNTPEEEREPQVVYEEVLDRRALASLDLSLRTSAMDNALSEILLQQSRLNESRRQYSEMLTQFESRLNETRTGATDRALKDVQSTLEDLTPIQAKEQIVKMMQAGLIDNVVEVLKAMSPDKRKKITAVFADDDEEFYKIIERMLTGSEGSLIDRTKEQVDAIKEQQT